MKKIHSLFTNLDATFKKVPSELEVSGLCSHSQLVVPNNLFVAKGKGADYIMQAVAAGASAVLTDMYNPFLTIPQIIHPDPKKIEPILAERMYDDPSRHLRLVAITGTNGKTTTSYLYRHIIQTVKGLCGLIGTVEYDTGNHTRAAALTTPDVLQTHKLLSEMVRAGCKDAVMEASSIGLAANRLAGLHIDTAVFTNLSQDHLDAHKTMDAYAAEKAKLFAMAEQHALIYSDDLYAHVMKEAFPKEAIGYSIEDVTILEQTASHSTFQFFSGETCRLPLAGLYNVANAIAAIRVADLGGISIEDSARALESFPGVPGRLEQIENDRGFHVFCDFAHTPDALKNLLTTLRPLTKERLIVVFGCGGDRDTEKRPQMGKIAETYADLCIITSDNPRSEDPTAICNNIASGCELSHPVIVDRKEAIHYAIDIAETGDIVVVAGRGHERRQMLKHHSIPFVDAEVIANALAGSVV